MRKSLFLLLSSAISFSSVLSQATGDYRSAATGNWNAAATWQRFDGASWVAAATPPSSTDGVITIRNTHTVTANTVITADQVVVENGGILSITGSTFTVANGAEDSDLLVNGTLNIEGGTLTGAGTTAVNNSANWTGGTIGGPVNINNGASMNKSTSTVTLNSVLTIQNGGVFNWASANINFNNGTLNNNGAFNITNANDVSLIQAGGVNAFNNNAPGTVNKSSGAGNIINGINVNNAGSFTISNATFTHNGNSFTNTGSINLNTGTFSIASTTNFNAGTSVTGTGTLALTGGTLNVNVNVTLPVNIQFNQSGGTVTGAGPLNIDGTANWTGGTIGGPVNINNGATLNHSTAFVSLNNVLTIQNGGVFNWISHNINFNTGTLNNNGTINFTNAADVSLVQFTGVNALNNNATGVLNKSSGAGNITSNINSNNAGAFNITDASFTHTGNTFTNTGSINLNNSSFSNSATLNFNAGTSVTGTGTLALTGGTLNVNVNVTLPVNIQFNQSGGTVTGAGPLNIDGTANWTGGTIGGPVNINNGATLNHSTAFVSLNNVLTIQNGGVFNWISHNINFNTGTLNNNGTINFTNAADVSLVQFTGVNALNNNATGVLNKSSGAGNITSNINSNNAGAFNITDASFTHTGNTFTNTGSINLNNSSFSNSATLNFNAGTSVTGTGTLALTGGTLNVNVNVTLPVNIQFNQSGGTVTGAGPLNIDGTANWTGGTIGGPVNINNGATLNHSTAFVSLNNVLTIQNGGVFNWISHNINFNTGTLNNNGTINFTNAADVSLVQFTGVNALNNNATGVLNKSSGAGNITSNINSNNAGAFNITDASFTHTGNTFTNTGSINLNNSSFSNSATLNFNAGTSVTGIGTLALTGGTLNVNVNVTLPVNIQFNQSGGTVTGAGPLNIDGTANWTGGTIGGPVNINNGATLNHSTAFVSLNNVLTIQNGGVFNWASANINFNTGTLNNNGTINFTNAADVSLVQFTGVNALNNNATGVLNKSSGDGIVISSIPVNNVGIIAGIGTFNFTGAFVNNGTISPGLSPGILIFNSTSALFSANSSLQMELMDGSGPGTGHDLLQRAGNLMLAGTLNVTETGTVPAGTYTIISLTSGTMSGAFNTVNLPPDYVLDAPTATTLTITKDIGSCTPSVSISASPGNIICQGTNVTFTAIPTNGGPTPAYQWKLNGNNVGTNSDTYQNASLAQGDMIVCEMTSSLGCANPQTVSSNTITMTVNPNVTAGTVSGTSPLCIGQTDTYTSNGTAGGTWSSSNTLVATVDAVTGLVTAVGAGNANIIYTVNTGCGSPVSAILNLTVNPNVTAGTVSGASSLCVGQTDTYTSNGTAGGVWSSSNTLVATVDAVSGFVTAIATGTTDITYTVNTGCGSPVSASKTLTVATDPVPGTVSGTSPLCIGQTNTYTSNGTPGGTWSSSNTAVATVNAVTGLVTAVGAGSTNIIYTVNACNGTPLQTMQNLTVNPNVTAGTVSGTSPLCIGQTNTYTSNGTPGGTWSSSNTAVATVNAVTGLVTAVGAGNANIIYTVNTGCGSPVNAMLNLTVNPNVTAGTVSGTSPLCIGQTDTYTSNGTPGGTWSSSNTLVATVDAVTGLVTAVGAGNANIIYTVNTGCGSPVNALLNLTVNPNVIAGTVSGVSPLCIGQTNTYTSNGTPGGTWSSSNTAVAIVNAVTGLVTAVGAGNANIIYTVNTGCGSPVNALLNLTVNPNVTAGTVNGASPLCIGQTDTYISNGTPGGTWSSSNTLVATVNAVTGFVTAIATGTTDITYTVNTGCGSPVSASKTLTVATDPVPGTVSGATPLCIGDTDTYSSTGTAGGVWSSSNTLVATVDAVTGLVTAVGAGSTNIIYTVNACDGTPLQAMQNLTVNPDVTAGTVSGTSPLCIGQTDTYTSNGTAGGVWSSSNTAVATVDAATGLVTAVGAGNANIIYTVNTGCGSPVNALLNLTVNPNVTAGTVSGTSPLCIGQTNTYTSNGTPGGTWSSSNTAVATVNAVTGLVTAVGAGNANIIYTVNTGCGSPVSAMLNLTVNPNVTAGVVSGPASLNTGQTATFTSNGTAGGSWSSSNTAVATVDAATGLVTAVAAGNANIIYTVSTGCGSPVSASAALTVIQSQLIPCGNSPNNVLVCHRGRTLCLNPNAAQVHLNHGDTPGECPPSSVKPFALHFDEDETAGQLKVSAFPNPFTTHFKLRILSPVSGTATISIYSINGVLLHEMRQYVSAGTVTLAEVKSASMPGQTIIYKVVIEGHMYRGTVIKN